MSHEDVRKPSAEYLETNGEAFEAHQAALASQYQPGTEEERKLVWKIDKRIVVSDPDFTAVTWWRQAESHRVADIPCSFTLRAHR
jgi:pantothenate kinase-related protein Tda10